MYTEARGVGARRCRASGYNQTTDRVVAVVGASSDRQKFGNKAVRAFTRSGYRVIPINPREPVIEGLPAYRSVLDYEGAIDLASFYVSPAIGLTVIEEVARKGIPEV